MFESLEYSAGEQSLLRVVDFGAWMVSSNAGAGIAQDKVEAYSMQLKLLQQVFFLQAKRIEGPRL